MSLLSPVHAAAEAFAHHLRDLGEHVGDVSHSTNRHGEDSSYIEIGGGLRIRVSDHEANQNFRVKEIGIHYEGATLERAVEILAQIEKNTAEQAQKVKAQIAARDAREAAAKAAYLATDKQHIRGNLIAQLYPNVSRAERQDIAARWLRQSK